MKPSILNKEANYSLHNVENYKKEFVTDNHVIVQKYYQLIIEYFKFILENLKIKNKNYSRFIIIRGLDTITNVFLNLLYYTKNIDLTYFHCQKSFYFYVEFVSQITEDEKMFLQLTSRDAATYVYKKTLFDINNEYKKMNEKTRTPECKNKLDIINIYVNIYKTLIHKMINDETIIVDDTIFQKFEKFNTIINGFNFSKEDLSKIEYIIDKLYYKIDLKVYFFDTIVLLMKKISKNINIIKKCEEKILCENIDNYLKENGGSSLFLKV